MSAMLNYNDTQVDRGTVEGSTLKVSCLRANNNQSIQKLNNAFSIQHLPNGKGKFPSATYNGISEFFLELCRLGFLWLRTGLEGNLAAFCRLAPPIPRWPKLQHFSQCKKSFFFQTGRQLNTSSVHTESFSLKRRSVCRLFF